MDKKVAYQYLILGITLSVGDLIVMDSSNLVARLGRKVVELGKNSLGILHTASDKLLKLVLENALKISGGVAGMTGRVHDEATVVLVALFVNDDNVGGDTIGILVVVLFAAMVELNLGHEVTGGGVKQSRLVVVFRKEDKGLPESVVVHRRHGVLSKSESLLQLLGDNVDHRVIGRLSRGRVTLGGVSNDAESGFVALDLDALDTVVEDGGVVLQHVDNSLQSSSRLVLVETKLEMHTHDGEIVTRVRKDEIKGRVAVLGLLELTEESLGVAEDVTGAQESGHGALHGLDRHLGTNGSTGSLGVAQLVTGTNSSPRNVVSNNHTDGRLDLLGGGPHERTISSSRSDGSVHNVVDLVGLKTEHLGKTSTDLITEKHGTKGDVSSESLLLASSNGNGVEVVVAELTSGVSELLIISEHGTVGVPLTDCRGVGENGLLGEDLGVVSKNCGTGSVLVADLVFKGLITKNSRRIRLEGKSRQATHDGISMEEFDTLQHSL